MISLASDLVDRRMLDQIRDMAPPDDDSFLERLVAMYVERSEELVATLRTGVDDGRIDTIRASSHSLKGSSASMGATVLARLCGELETMARANAVDAAASVMDQIEHMHPLVCENLTAMARRQPA